MSNNDRYNEIEFGQTESKAVPDLMKGRRIVADLGIESIGIANFKAFKDKQTFKAKPLTLLVGPNSSGKSSLIHSLALLNQLFLHGTERDVSKTQLGGDAIDLGGFAHYVHNKNYKDGVTIDFNLNRFETSLVEGRSHKTEKAKLTLSLKFGASVDDYGALTQSLPNLKSLELKEEGELIFRLIEDGIVMRIEGFNVQADNFFSNLVRESFRIKKAKGQEGKQIRDWYKFFDPDIDILFQEMDELEYERKFFKKLNAVFNWGLNTNGIAFDISNPSSFSLIPTTMHNEMIAVALGVNGLPDIGDLIKKVDVLKSQRDDLLGKTFGRGKRDAILEKFNRDILQGYRDLAWQLRVDFESCLHTLVESIENHFAKMTYLGPLRKLPIRDFIVDKSEVSDVVSGEYAWSVLAEDRSLRQQVNKWLGSEEFMKTPYQLDVKYFGEVEKLHDNSIKALKQTLRDFDLSDLDQDFHPLGKIGEWLKEVQEEIRMDKASEEIDEWKKGAQRRLSEEFDPQQDTEESLQAHDEWIDEANFQEELEGSISRFRAIELIAEKKYLVLRDKRNGATVTHRDVGVGISQVLPVLATLFGSEEETIAIEQPELHLHPALQAELGDVCIQSVQENKNSLLLETHSEHLILRIMRRIREGTLSHEDVSVIFVQPEKKGSSLKYLRIDKDGDFIDEWPDGFFAERRKELF